MNRDRFLLLHATCAAKGFAVVAGIDAVDTDAAAPTAGGMDELSLADIHADMPDSRVDGVEENEVAGFHARFVDMVTHAELGARRVRQRDALFPHEVHRQSRAVEAARTIAAPSVGSSAIRVSGAYEFVCGCGAIGFGHSVLR